MGSTDNHFDIEDYLRKSSLEEIYIYLTDVFANEDFQIFRDRCKQVASYLHNNHKPSYSRVKFNSVEHKINSTMAQEYLNCLPDEDPNADLKTLKPVEIISDGSALFRSVATLLGLSREEDVRELRLRSFLDAVLNWLNYVNEYSELQLQRRASNPNETSLQNWSHQVHEKDQMNEPNIITVFILISLAKVINIPIRSVYPTPSTRELNENSDHIYNFLNQVFYPVPNQHHDTETTLKPIVIMWWYTQTKGVTCPNTVIPLFSANQYQSDEQYPENLILSKNSDITHPLNRNPNSSVVRRRGRFILIVTSISGGTKYQIRKRIRDMKVTIIQRMENIAANARPGDIIEVNTCDKELTKPSLIPFCEATTVNAEKKVDLINAIKFREAAHSNLSHCISAAQDRLARQSVYYTDFFLFVDNLIDGTDKTSIGKSVFRVLNKSRSINSQIFISSEELIDSKTRLMFPGRVSINYLPSINNDTRDHRSNKSSRPQKTILYKRNSSSQDVEKPEPSTAPISVVNDSPLLMNTNVRFVEQHQNNGYLSKISAHIRQMVSIKKKETVSSQERYRVRTPDISQFKFKFGFS